MHTSVPCAPGHVCQGTNGDTVPTWARPRATPFTYALLVAPTPARGVVKMIQTHGPHPQRGDAAPSLKGSAHQSLGSRSAWGPHYGCAPYQPVRPGSSSPNLSAHSLPISRVPVSITRQSTWCRRSAHPHAHPPPNPHPPTHTHTHTHTHAGTRARTARTQLPPSSPLSPPLLPCCFCPSELLPTPLMLQALSRLPGQPQVPRGHEGSRP